MTCAARSATADGASAPNRPWASTSLIWRIDTGVRALDTVLSPVEGRLEGTEAAAWFAGEDHVHRGQQDGELVFVIGVLVAGLEALVQQVPAIRLLDQGQLLQ